MTAKKDSTQQRISQERVARIRFVKNVIDFIQSILRERGEVLLRTVGFTHTHTIRELHNFEGCFSFYADTGQSIVGGNIVKIWYHPGNQYTRGVGAVLNAWWLADIEKCRLDTFDDDKQWQRKIQKIIHRRKVNAAQAVQVTAASKKRVQTKYEEEMYQQHLSRKLKGLYAL